jgi:cell division protein FtsL
MNTYTKAFKPAQAPRSGRSQASNSWLFPLAMVGIMGALIFLAVNFRISYDEKAENLNREASRVKMKIHRLNLEIANLKIRKESLSSWDRIGSKIKSYNLALRPAEPDQVRGLALVNGRAVSQALVRADSSGEAAKKLQVTSK